MPRDPFGYPNISHQYRYQKLAMEDVVPFLGTGRRLVWVEDRLCHIEIYFSGRRLRVFRDKGTQCLCCGIQGDHWWVERRGNQPPHLNLYALRDGEPVAMTCDHIMPRCRGGTDRLENLQPLCETCNILKGGRIISIEDLRRRIRNYVISIPKNGPFDQKFETSELAVLSGMA